MDKGSLDTGGLNESVVFALSVFQSNLLCGYLSQILKYRLVGKIQEMVVLVMKLNSRF